MLCTHFRCGIPAVEMMGQREDWINLGQKFKELQTILKPIDKDIGLNNWWIGVNEIFYKLLETFDGNPDKRWWSKIISLNDFGSGRDPMTGWFVTEFLRETNVISLNEVKSSLITVPMTFVDDSTDESEQAAVVAGIVGYKIYDKKREIPKVEANHSWALMLEPNSIFRNDLERWEKALAA